MAESTTAPRKKNRRSTAKSEKLETARTRLVAQLAAERERERRVMEALEAFVAAGERIAAVDATCDAKVAELENRIARHRELANEKTETERTSQAVAAFTMHDAGRKVQQVAELLDVPVREVRELIATGRAAISSETQATSSGRPVSTAVPTPPSYAGQDAPRVKERPVEGTTSVGGTAQTA